MQNNNMVLVAVVMLVFGLGVGYVVGNDMPGHGARMPAYQNTSGVHMMPDGSMMGNGAGSVSMSDMMHDMNAALIGKTGDEFDKAFISEMIVHHEGAVDMAELALTNAKHQEIKDLARAIISAQNKEISDMRAWQRSWYGQ
jgi:uncharacterized protein (DUF305 family)